MSFPQALAVVLDGQDLKEDEASEAMADIMAGSVPLELITAFLAALRVKGETAPEIAGFAQAMRNASVRIRSNRADSLLDTCSTGGARVKMFNLGTPAAIVAASAGIPVAKHGNRSSTRPTGSADLLEALGADLTLPPPAVQAVLEEVGFAFLFSPLFHPAMKYAAPARKALASRTVFNVLGPLANPAGANRQVLGVYDRRLLGTVSDALVRLRAQHALILHCEGADEPRLDHPTEMVEVREGNVRRRTLEPAQLGLKPATPADLAPMPPGEAASEVRRILGGANGPRSDAVRLNAALALYVGGAVPTIAQGLDRADDLLHSHLPLQKLDDYLAATRRRGQA